MPRSPATTKNPYKVMYKGVTSKKDGMHRPEGAGNFDHMDDYTEAQSCNFKQGTIQHTPTNAKDIVNKEYVDSQESGLWEVSGGNTQLITPDDILIQADNKLKIRDDDVFFQSDIDGKFRIDADGEIEFNTAALDFNASIGASFTGATILGTFGLSSTATFQIRDSGLQITSSADGQMDIDADGELEITSPIVDIDASTGLALDGANLNSNWTVNSTNKIQFRDTGLFIHSSSDGNLLVEADTLLTLGTAGDITLGDSTERDLYPNNDNKINLGKSANRFNDWYVGDGDVEGDLVFTESTGKGLCYSEIYVQGNATADTVATATNTQMTRFDTDGEENNCTADHTSDHITITKAGRYLVTISISFSGTASVDWSFSLYKNNGATEFPNVHCNRKLGSGGDIGSASMSGIIDVAANDTVELWMIQGSGVDKDITVQDCTLSIVQIGGS